MPRQDPETCDHADHVEFKIYFRARHSNYPINMLWCSSCGALRDRRRFSNYPWALFPWRLPGDPECTKAPGWTWDPDHPCRMVGPVLEDGLDPEIAWVDEDDKFHHTDPRRPPPLSTAPPSSVTHALMDRRLGLKAART